MGHELGFAQLQSKADTLHQTEYALALGLKILWVRYGVYECLAGLDVLPYQMVQDSEPIQLELLGVL